MSDTINHPAIATITAVKHVRGQASTKLGTSNISIPMETPSTAKTGKIRFGINMRVPEVFGAYSSLEVSVSLEGEGDINNFEEFNNQLMERAVTWTRSSINDISVAAGGNPVFGNRKV